MSNMEEHVLIQIFNLLTCAQHSTACRMLSVITKFFACIFKYLLVFSLVWRPPAGKVLYSWLSACEFNFLCLMLLPFSTHLVHYAVVFFKMIAKAYSQRFS